MKKSFAAIVLMFSVFTTILAQREQTVVGDAGFNLSGAWGGWNYNLGQFNKDFQTYSGGMWALEFGKKFYIGSTHYRMNNQFIGSSTTNTYNLASNSLLLGYTPISYRAVHPIISLGVGSGNITTKDASDRAFMLTPAAGIEFNVTRWCHIDAQVSYRSVLDTDFTQYSSKDFSGVYGQVNLKFGYSWGRYRSTNSSSRKKYEKD
jgi:hypothetical protein